MVVTELEEIQNGENMYTHKHGLPKKFTAVEMKYLKSGKRKAPEGNLEEVEIEREETREDIE